MREKTRTKKIIGILIYIVFLLVAFEIILRIGGFLILQNEEPKIGDDKFVILAIGDSTTYGLGVNQERAYPNQLEIFLKNKYPDKDIVVLNKGIPAQTSISILRNIDSQMIKYKPDLVISLVGVNDYNEALNGVNSRSISGFIISEPITELRVYKFFSILRDFLDFRTKIQDGALIFYDSSRKFTNISDKENCLDLDYQLEDNYKEIIDKIHYHDSEIIILSYLHKNEKLDRIFENISKEKRILYISLNEENVNQSLFTDDGWHPNEMGHEIMAEKIAEEIPESILIK